MPPIPELGQLQSEPTLAPEVVEEGTRDQGHREESEPESDRRTRAREVLEVHPIDTRYWRRWQDYGRDDRERLHHLVHLIREDHQVHLQDTGNEFPIGLYRLELADQVIIEAPEVDLCLWTEIMARPIREPHRDLTHRCELSAQEEEGTLQLEDLFYEARLPTVEDPVVQFIDEIIDLVEEWEVLIDEGVEDLIREMVDTTGEEVSPTRKPASYLGGRLRMTEVRGHDEPIPDEEVEVLRIEEIRSWLLRPELGLAYDDEECAVVLPDLDPTLRGPYILDGQGVEVEEVGEESVLLVILGIDIEPEGALPRLEECLELIECQIIPDPALPIPEDEYRSLPHSSRSPSSSCQRVPLITERPRTLSLARRSRTVPLLLSAARAPSQPHCRQARQISEARSRSEASSCSAPIGQGCRSPPPTSDQSSTSRSTTPASRRS